MDLQGQVAWITGGSKGIGLGVAEALVREGVHVVLSARGERDLAHAVEHLSSLEGGDVVGAACDVRDGQRQREVAQSIDDRFGRLDLLVANAGIGRFGAVDALTDEAWHDVLDVNVTGVFHAVRAGLPALERTQGTIVTIGSLAGANPFAGGAAYVASKFAVLGFTHSIMLDLRDRGVRVSTIMPGSVATHFGGHAPGPDDDWKIQPEDVGALVVTLMKMPARTLPSKVEVRPSRPRTRAR